MRNARNRAAMALATVATVAVSPALAQQAVAPAVIDGVPYALSQDATKNVDAVRVLIKVADGMGLVRNIVRTLGGTVQTMEYRGTGTMGGQNVSFIVSYDSRLPAIRQDVTLADKSRVITVASGDTAWDESKPGVFSQAGKTPAADRIMPLYLLPTFVVYEGAANAGSMKLASAAGGNQVLTIPVARYKTDLKATVNAKNEVVHTEMTVGGKVYSADFSNYSEDRMQYHVNFPHKIVQKVDGQTVADLTVESHVPGPYAVWPIPPQMKPTAAK